MALILFNIRPLPSLHETIELHRPVDAHENVLILCPLSPKTESTFAKMGNKLLNTQIDFNLN